MELNGYVHSVLTLMAYLMCQALTNHLLYGELLCVKHAMSNLILNLLHTIAIQQNTDETHPRVRGLLPAGTAEVNGEEVNGKV